MGNKISIRRPFFKIRRNTPNNLDDSPNATVEYEYVDTIRDANFAWLEGRRVSAEDFYPAERYAEETDRLAILMHNIFKYILRGNSKTPLTSEMKRCLHIGSGHYIWLLEMANENSNVQFEGFDISPTAGNSINYPIPSNANFINGNIFDGGLPYPDEHFDYVNVRTLLTWLPIDKIVFVIEEVRRITKRGGKIEILELDTFVKNSTTYYEDNLGKIWKDICSYKGYVPDNIINLNKHLKGFSEMKTSKLSIPIGKYGGQVGELYAETFIGGMTAIAAVMMEKLNMTDDDIQSYLQNCVDGLNLKKSYVNSYLVCAKRTN